jgi:hypothetical protein
VGRTSDGEQDHRHGSKFANIERSGLLTGLGKPYLLHCLAPSAILSGR